MAVIRRLFLFNLRPVPEGLDGGGTREGLGYAARISSVVIYARDLGKRSPSLMRRLTKMAGGYYAGSTRFRSC